MMLVGLLIGLSSATDAHAINNMRFCARITTSYHDVRSGQDYLVNPAAEPATRHWASIVRAGSVIWSGFLADTTLPSGNVYGCTAYMPIGGATFHEFWVGSEVQVDANKYIAVYPGSTNSLQWHKTTFNTPANPTGDSTFSTIIAGNQTDHVSLIATRIRSSWIYIPAGSTDTYRYIYANDPNGVSHTNANTDTVYIGSITVNGATDYDAYWRSVVGHEMGHQVAFGMWGAIWQGGYDDNTATGIAACTCDFVEDPNDRLHCLNSREGMAAARSEGWGHAFSTQLVNSITDSTAPFGYYKRVYDPQAQNQTCVSGQPHVLCAPVTADGALNFNWMESYCNQSNAGIELDWFAFFYQLDNYTANSWTPANFWNVFYTECPSGSCAVTWNTLQTASASYFGSGSAKALYMASAGDANGVNH
jgi:hypothetical protein